MEHGAACEQAVPVPLGLTWSTVWIAACATEAVTTAVAVVPNAATMTPSLENDADLTLNLREG